MSSLTADLDRLKSELGEQHYLLQRAPFERLVVEPLSDDPLALSFKILFGYIMVKAANQDISSPSVDSAVEDLGVFTKQQIWIHLYPAVKPGSSVEIQVHSYALDGGYIGKQDRENIGRTASGCAAAFALPGRCKWSRSKLVALAKYYFLRKLVETGSEEDKEKMLLGIPISKTFREDLKAVCRDFEEEVKDMGPPITRAAAEAEQTDSQESELSDLTQGFLEENGSEITASVVVKNDLATPTRGMAEVTRDTKPSSRKVTTQEFAKLHQDEEAIVKDIDKMGQEIAMLEARYRAKQKEQKRIKKRKEEMFQGMSLLDAFNLGRDIERDNAEKRRKLG